MLKTYAHHKPSPAALEKIRAIREGYSAIHALIEATCPASRERSIALTEIETSAMWAIKALVCNDPASEVEYPAEVKEPMTLSSFAEKAGMEIIELKPDYTETDIE